MCRWGIVIKWGVVIKYVNVIKCEDRIFEPTQANPLCYNWCEASKN